MHAHIYTPIHGHLILITVQSATEKMHILSETNGVKALQTGLESQQTNTHTHADVCLTVASSHRREMLCSVGFS